MRIVTITTLGIGLLALTFAASSLVRQERVHTEVRANAARSEQSDAALGRRVSQIDTTLSALSDKDIEQDARLAEIVERLNRNETSDEPQAERASPRADDLPGNSESFRLLGVDEIADREIFGAEDAHRVVAALLPEGDVVHTRYDKPLDANARQIAESILSGYVSFFYGRRKAFRECARSGIGVEAVHPTLQAAIADKNGRSDHNHFEIVENAGEFALVDISVVEHDPELKAILEALTQSRQDIYQRGYREETLPTFPADD